MASRVELVRLLLPELTRLAVHRLARGPARPGWSWRAEIARRAMFAVLMASRARGVPWLREAQALVPLRSPLLGEVAFAPVDANGVAAAWCTPRAPRPAERTVVYLHGGGYVIGSVDAYRETLARIAVGASARVLGVDYRLAPEHPFPAAFDDCLAAARFALAEAPAGTVALAGDSAGGALAVAAACALRDAGEPLPAACVLISPWVDPFASGGSMDTNVPFDFADRSLLVHWAEQALAGAPADDPRFTVLGADLAGLPPLLLQFGGAEILLDQVRTFVARAREAGVDVVVDEVPDMFHVFQMSAALLPEGALAMERIARFLREHVAGEPRAAPIRCGSAGRRP